MHASVEKRRVHWKNVVPTWYSLLGGGLEAQNLAGLGRRPCAVSMFRKLVFVRKLAFKTLSVT